MVKVVGDGQNVVKLDTTLVVVTLVTGIVWVGVEEEVEFTGYEVTGGIEVVFAE